MKVIAKANLCLDGLYDVVTIPNRMSTESMRNDEILKLVACLRIYFEASARVAARFQHTSKTTGKSTRSTDSLPAARLFFQRCNLEDLQPSSLGSICNA